MLHCRGDEEYTAGGDFVIFFLTPPLISHAGSKAAFSTDHVVNLIFMMRSLCIGGARSQNVESGAHGRNPQKLLVKLAVPQTFQLDFRNPREKLIHAKIPPKTSRVNCGIRFSACNAPSGLYHW